MAVKPFHKASKVNLYNNIYSWWGASAKNYTTDSTKKKITVNILNSKWERVSDADDVFIARTD